MLSADQPAVPLPPLPLSLPSAGTISDVIPTLVERNAVKGGVSVHTTILFSGSCEAGKAAARTLHVKLLGDVRPLFYVPAPRAKSLFGDVYMITVSHPYLVSQVMMQRAMKSSHAHWRQLPGYGRHSCARSGDAQRQLPRRSAHRDRHAR